MIEFDEFIEWLTNEELDLAPGEDADVPKPSFEHLATRYKLSLDFIMSLYKDIFLQFLPSGVKCNYPGEPGALTKWQIRRCFTEFFPETEEDDFEDAFSNVDFNGSGEIEFDEFLDFGFDTVLQGYSNNYVNNSS